MIVINSSTRQFSIPGADLVFGVESDRGSEVKNFQCPRYVGNKLDLAGSFIRINYRNANGEIDSYLVKDVTIDGDNVLFGWELSPKVTAYKGNVSFVMCVVGPDTKLAWHTTLGRGQVLEGLEPESAMIEEGTADIVAQLITMVEAQTGAVEAVGEKWVADVKAEGATQVQTVKTAAQSAQSDAVAQIEAKGVNTLTTIPEDYTALSEAVDTLNRTRGAAIVCEAAGETVVVSDASDLPMQGLRVFGKTTQVTTTGAQLLDFSAMSVDSGGTTKAIITDGGKSVKIVGTKAYAMGYIDVDVSARSGETVYLSGEKSGGNNPSLTVRLIKADGTKTYITTATTGYTILEDDATIQMQFIANNTATTLDVATTATFSNVILSVTQGAAWEPYSDGVTSPSPDFPQELVSLEPVVEVCGKNLFDKNKYVFIDATTIDNDTGELKSTTPNGWRSSENFLMVKPSTTYMLSGSIVPNSWTITVAFYNSDKKYLGFIKVTNYGGRGNFKIETPENTAYLRFNAHLDSLDINTIQLEEGSAVTDYEPGNSQLLTITHPLPGLPVSSGGNYTDSDGQQWICDEVDLERGVYIQRVKRTTFDGDEVWAKSGTHSYYTRVPESKRVQPMCDRLGKKTDDISPYVKDGTTGDGVNAIIVSFGDIGTNTLDEFKVLLTQNPLAVQYALATPIETALSETEIAAYRAMHSNYPNTTVLNDSGAHMVVKYAADTKLYIDNKITALIGG